METLTVENFLTLGMLILLQAVLGFDNLLYISLESQNAPPAKQKYVRVLGISLAIVLRIGLLFLLITIFDYFKQPLFKIHDNAYFEGDFNVHGMIVLIGGIFIIYTALKEIWHMISMEEHSAMGKSKKQSLNQIVTMIVIMNLVFSIDSILSAMALTKVFWVMTVAIILGGILMIWLSERVARFLKKNRMYEVLGLFILFLVGVMLITEGGHISHLAIFGNKISPMNKTTFYFVIACMVIVDVVQGRYKKKLMREKAGKTQNETTESTNS